MNLAYDAKNRISSYTNSGRGQSTKTGFVYGDLNNAGERPGLLYGVRINDTQKYDSLFHLSKRTLNTSTSYTTEYEYMPGFTSGSTTAMVKSIKNGSSAISYTYGSWGKLLQMDGDGPDGEEIGNNNPFRYRGYYYDAETGFYYLNSTCYDPAACRMLSADKQLHPQLGFTGINMFAYCGNDPVMDLRVKQRQMDLLRQILNH